MSRPGDCAREVEELGNLEHVTVRFEIHTHATLNSFRRLFSRRYALKVKVHEQWW